MSVNKDLRWLRTPGLKGAAKRFTEFCKKDIPKQIKSDPEFDIEIYSDTAKLIIEKLKNQAAPVNIAKGSNK